MIYKRREELIISFKDQGSEDIYHGRRTQRSRKKLPESLRQIAIRKLDMMNAAYKIEDLKVPPGNRLETLRGKYHGFYSIRINNQYRIIFKWTARGAEVVEIIDYH